MRSLIPAVQGDAMQFSKLSAKYLRWVVDYRGGSRNTADTYDLVYRQFLAHLSARGLEDSLRNFTPDTVESFAQALVDAGASPNTVCHKLAALQSLGKYGTQHKDERGKYYLQENPAVRVERPKRTKPPERFLYLEELKQLMAVPCEMRERIALELVVDTALRASEVTDPKVRDLRLDGERVVLTVKVKGGRTREIRLGESTSNHLVEYLKHREAGPDEPLLLNAEGGPMSRARLSETIAKLARKAGITRIPVRAHVLRHSIASLLDESGASVPAIAAVLNHSNTATVATYVHNRAERLDAIRDRVREMLR